MKWEEGTPGRREPRSRGVRLPEEGLDDSNRLDVIQMVYRREVELGKSSLSATRRCRHVAEEDLVAIGHEREELFARQAVEDSPLPKMPQYVLRALRRGWCGTLLL